VLAIALATNTNLHLVQTWHSRTVSADAEEAAGTGSPTA
jgi:hypothetical protein